MLKSVEKINHIFITILNLVYVNFLWWLFTLLGLGIFGAGPATYALVSIIRQWMRGNTSVPIFSSYWKYYKESFKESMVTSWIYLLLGYVLVIDLLHVTNWYLKVCLMIIFSLYFLSAVYIYPLMAHYNWKGIFFRIKMSFIFGFSCLQYSLLLFVVIGATYWTAITLFPGILTFFGISFLFYMITWTANQVFTRMELQNTEEVEDTTVYPTLNGQ
ncbi:DUF624 domain-containing protein [Niallia circulans]|jgi:uncharacterized membrane protein YesL|uniref:Uncharacterized protein n=1 Tax=Niallia circulans TaxID=1397 RepID=A0A268FFB5_NIACI|nr:DUF624 domain-containing protein [Niallia circulans]AYV68539.1 DUF624 domain-containing protein [Niallia circulans]NRG26730.1 DUF624 domain-containing protein [Niallia circulans]PAD84060.1 hypothetical protein CHH57_06285 [Niallia circulans]QJX64446.1 DUF624 domain-containing protein [Niallia circulans]UQZ75400.1 DUF624 domain-containing protein [Niallia circulans]